MAPELGRLLLRLAIGGLLLLHGIGKLRHGIGGIIGDVDAKGLPHAFAYLVYVGEVVAPIFVLLGWLTRPAAAAIAINMMVAVWLKHSADVMNMGKTGGYALELQALYFAGAIAIALLGSGRYAVGGGAGRFS